MVLFLTLLSIPPPVSFYIPHSLEIFFLSLLPPLPVFWLLILSVSWLLAVWVRKSADPRLVSKARSLSFSLWYLELFPLEIYVYLINICLPGPTSLILHNIPPTLTVPSHRSLPRGVAGAHSQAIVWVTLLCSQLYISIRTVSIFWCASLLLRHFLYSSMNYCYLCTFCFPTSAQ